MNRRVLIFVFVIAVLLVGAFTLPVREWLTQLLEWIDTRRQIAALAFTGAYILACVLMLPGLILTIAAGALFGLVQGVVLVSLASVAGATAAFVVGRWFARDWLRARAQSLPQFNALDRALQSS
jgi:uncharacterized membrane protein YdjX (TVP38/TMEM64 family)